MAVEKLNKREVDYLLLIFLKSRDIEYVKQKELREELKVSKPTVSLMIKKLSKKELVTSGKEGVRLTEKGEKTVLNLLWRHGVLENALVSLGLPAKKACEITCEIELLIPEEAVTLIWEKLGMPRQCPCGIEFPTEESGELFSYSVCRPNLSQE